MTVSFQVAHITRDRRTKAQLESARKIDQDRADQAIERLWNERVRANVQARINRRVEAFLQEPSATDMEISS